MEWLKITENENGSPIMPKNWIFSYYYETLNILFRIENALRIFVYIILKKEFKDKWIDINISDDENGNNTIKNIAKKRIEQDNIFGYIGYKISSPMMYLTSGELIRIIVSESYWKLFKKYFQGSKEIIKNKLDEINNIRNALSHFRPIKSDDVDLIIQNSKHVLISIESFLSDILNCSKFIPSNTGDDWYKKLKLINSDLVTLSFMQNGSEDWIRIKLKIKSVVISRHRTSSTFLSYQVTNIITPNILLYFPVISKYVIYVCEDIPYINSIDGIEDKIFKDVYLLFNKQAFIDDIDSIEKELSTLLLNISEEVELIKEDNLARGKLITINSLMAKCYEFKSQAEKQWFFDSKYLYNSIETETSAEYWGNIYTYMATDFISSNDKYPWFPVSVSNSEPRF